MKIKFFIIGSIFIISCLNIKAMKNENIKNSVKLNQQTKINNLDFKNKEIENENIQEIDNFMALTKKYQQDLINLKKETTNEEVKNKINDLIKTFVNINLDLINIYSSKAESEKIKTNISPSRSTFLLHCLCNNKNYLKNINRILNKEEIFNSEIIKKLDETKEKISNAQYKILKTYYINYLLNYIYYANKHITKSWVYHHLRFLKHLKDDCYHLFQETDIGHVNSILGKLMNLKNKFENQ